MRRVYLIAALSALAATPAFADIPVNDAALLTQRSETSAAKVKLVPVTTQRQDANKGVNCAVTTGKKANVTDPTVQPQSGAGAQKIQTYSPDTPVTPDANAQGPTLGNQTLFQSAGTVVGGIDASRSTLSAAQSAFSAAGQLVGSAGTVMAALDSNSAARLQNNLAWNGVIGSANLWLTAINALNLAAAGDMSRAAAGMRAATAAISAVTGAADPPGAIGAGTSADPCRFVATCQAAASGSSQGEACVSARYVDTNGNVLFYLDQIQSAAAAAASAGR